MGAASELSPTLGDMTVLQPGQEAPGDSDVYELTQHLVTIERDPMTKLPKEIFDHELPILYNIYGEDKIQILDTKTVDVYDFDPDYEYDRLSRAYPDDANKDAVVKVYGRDGRILAKELGLKYDSSFAAKRNKPRMSSAYQVGAGSQDALNDAATQSAIAQTALAKAAASQRPKK